MKSATAIEKVVKALADAGAEGMRRQELRLRVELPADTLSNVIDFLVARGELHQEAERPIGAGGTPRLRGRLATRYFYTASGAPYPEELPPEFSTPRKLDPTTAPVPHAMVGPSVCAWCGTPLPMQYTGRPRQFCKRECRDASALAASMQLLGILQRPVDPFVFNATARLIVAADLTSRGFRVCGLEGLLPLLVDRGGQLLRIGVYIADAEGRYFEGEDSVDARAIVRRDGAIRYVGAPFISDAQEDGEGAGGEEEPQQLPGPVADGQEPVAEPAGHGDDGGYEGNGQRDAHVVHADAPSFGIDAE